MFLLAPVSGIFGISFSDDLLRNDVVELGQIYRFALPTCCLLKMRGDRQVYRLEDCSDGLKILPEK